MFSKVCRSCLWWHSDLSNCQALSFRPTGQPQKKPVGRAFATGDAEVPGGVDWRTYWDAAEKRCRRLVGRGQHSAASKASKNSMIKIALTVDKTSNHRYTPTVSAINVTEKKSAAFTITYIIYAAMSVIVGSSQYAGIATSISGIRCLRKATDAENIIGRHVPYTQRS